MTVDDTRALSSYHPDDQRALHKELKDIIRRKLEAHPRSQQIDIGASEIGTPCTRKLVWKLGNVTPVNDVSSEWYTALGIASHDWLADALLEDNARSLQTRWHAEQEVVIGTVGEKLIYGHYDVYDVLTCTVVDWKNPLKTNVRNMKRRKHPGVVYEVQAHCYGKGVEDAGLEVKYICIAAIPQGGTLDDAWFWSAPYDRTIAEQALQRAHALEVAAQTIGHVRLGAISGTDDDHCLHCPWFKASGADPAKGECPGGPVTQKEWQAKQDAAQPRPYTGWTKGQS